jgi:hypothetical protein
MAGGVAMAVRLPGGSVNPRPVPGGRSQLRLA